MINACAAPAVPRMSARRWTLAFTTLAAAAAIAVAMDRAADLRRATESGTSSATNGDGSTQGKSLAVLPFSSVGGDTANAYFAEGIADELTTALSRVPNLRVAGRASAARFKAQSASAQDIGDALGVTTILNGTVRRSGDRIRVAAELTSVRDGTVLWTEIEPLQFGQSHDSIRF